MKWLQRVRTVLMTKTVRALDKECHEDSAPPGSRSLLNSGNFEIGRVLHFQSEIRNLELDCKLLSAYVQFEISDFGLEMQDLSNFEFSVFRASGITPAC